MNQAGDSGVTALVDAAFNGHASASSLLLVSDEGKQPCSGPSKKGTQKCCGNAVEKMRVEKQIHTGVTPLSLYAALLRLGECGCGRPGLPERGIGGTESCRACKLT